jgi:hypothetical protein
LFIFSFIFLHWCSPVNWPYFLSNTNVLYILTALKAKRPRGHSSGGAKKQKAAQVLIPKLEAAASQIMEALSDANLEAFDSGEQKKIKRLLRELHSCTDTMNSAVAKSTGVAEAVKKLANRHKDDKVKKWANGLVDTWMQKFGSFVATKSPSKEVTAETASADVVSTIPKLQDIVDVLSKAYEKKSSVLSKEERSSVKMALGHVLDNADVTVETLKSTGLGKVVKRLSKHTDPKVKKWAGKLVQVFITKFAPPPTADAAPVEPIPAAPEEAPAAPEEAPAAPEEAPAAPEEAPAAPEEAPAAHEEAPAAPEEAPAAPEEAPELPNPAVPETVPAE